MGENRDKYSGKRKVKGVVCSKTEEWSCPVGAFFNDTGL
jgi:hypothetical protein